MIDIHLYLGAHKTATTHLQGILLANRARLLSHNIALSAPQNVRKEWLPNFFNYCNNPKREQQGELAASLTSIAPLTGLWILTEENIVGVSNDFAIKPGMYPTAADRIKCLTELFADANISLYFSLRSYESFYRSAYSEVVRNRGYIPFERFYSEARFKNNSWVTMIQAIQEVLPQEKITLWKFEDFRELVPRLVSLMTGIDEATPLIEAYKPETTRPSLSQKTIEILASLHPVLKRKESLTLVERINRAYPLEAGHPPYQPFSIEQQTIFRTQYHADIETIKKSFPRIRFLEAEAGSSKP